MNSLIQKIDEIIDEYSLLKHPFYQSWSDGKLSLESLAGYSKEYYQLVKAVPTFFEKVIKHTSSSNTSLLISHHKEEIEHIQPWKKFAGVLGISEEELDTYPGLEKTNKAISKLGLLMDSFEGGSAALYALEKEIPKISQTKLDGLKEFYGITSDTATNYFVLHTEADIRHTAAWRSILENCTDYDKLVDIADKSVHAQNLLLDSCYEAYC